MVDVSNIKYKLLLILADSRQIDVTNAASDLGWEEGKGELASRLSFSLANILYEGKSLSELAPPGTMAAVIADWGSGSDEVIRGYINDWDPEFKGSEHTFDVIAYDELYNLEQSQDNRYYPAGTGTKNAIMGIFNDWGIPVESYNGPDISHGKTIFKNDYLGDIILGLLDAAEKKGSGKYIIRCTKGKVSVLPRGSNAEVYHFEETKNTLVSRDKVSIANLVTRVKIIGKEDTEGRQPVEAIIDGKTEFGVRQRIYSRSEDDSLDAAKKAGNEIIEDKGTPKRTIVIETPDIPMIRKGDMIHVKVGTLDGYFYTDSVRHDAANTKMQMEISPYVQNESSAQTSSANEAFEKGDRVILNGAVYRDSYGTGKGRTFNDYHGAITIKVDTSRACPYHVDGIGWVYPGTIRKE